MTLLLNIIAVTVAVLFVAGLAGVVFGLWVMILDEIREERRRR